MTPLVSLTLQPSIVVIPATNTSTDKAAVEKAVAEKAAVEKPAVEKVAVEKAAVEKAAVEKAAAEEEDIIQFLSPSRNRSQPRFCFKHQYLSVW